MDYQAAEIDDAGGSRALLDEPQHQLQALPRAPQASATRTAIAASIAST
jgi:hypothetical protein